jgi:hypothetical protein
MVSSPVLGPSLRKPRRAASPHAARFLLVAGRLLFSVRSHMGMDNKPTTKADSLRFALAFALRSVRLAKHRLGLSEETRYRIADEAVNHLVRDERWPELLEESKLRPLADGSTDERTL